MTDLTPAENATSTSTTPVLESDTYNANSIRVLTDDEILDSFDWAKIGHLASQYKRDSDFIERGLLACERVGVHYSYFVGRYLENDKTIPMREDVNAAMADILKEMRV
jgi:hypothetical protein